MKRLSLSSVVVLAIALAGAAAAPARHVESVRLTASIVRALADDQQPAIALSATSSSIPAGRVAAEPVHRTGHISRQFFPHALYQRPPPPRR